MEETEMEETERDINWHVVIEVTVNGEEVRFDELEEYEQEVILNSIKEDYYSGTFLTYK